MNADLFSNINEFNLSGMNDLKVPNINENVNNEILSSNIILMNSNNQKLINYQLLNSYQQLPQNSQAVTSNFEIQNPVTVAVTTQPKLPSTNETIDNKQLEFIIQNSNSKLIAVTAAPTATEIKTENPTITDSSLYYRNNNPLYSYYKGNSIPYISNVDELNQNINYVPNIDNLYLFNNINSINGLNNIPLGGIAETSPSDSVNLLTDKLTYNPSKYITMDPNNYLNTNTSSTSIQTVNNTNLNNTLYINNNQKNTLINQIPHSNEIITMPPHSVNTINKETKYIYKRRKRQTIDKTSGNIIQKKMKKKTKINQDLIHEKPGGLVSVNFLHNRSPLNEPSSVYTTGFRGRRLRGKYEYIQQKLSNPIDYQQTNLPQNYNEINSSTVTSSINYSKAKKDVESINPSYLQLQLNSKIQNPEFFPPFITSNSEIINNFTAINTKPEVNPINQYFTLNDPKAIPKPLTNPQYILNKNEIKKEEKINTINNLSSISENSIFEALTSGTFESSSSSISSSPKSSSLTASSITTLNNGFQLNSTINTTSNTISYVTSKTDQIKYNNIYPYA